MTGKSEIDDARKFSVAPMMDWTDRWCRRFHRLLTRRALLFTEMVVDHAVVRGDRDRLLGFDVVEKPLALQLGGSDPRILAEAARIGARAGYDEINLNIGCPSDRVQSGAFGACLMRRPELVAECLAAMAEASTAPVTVKCRTGVDEDVAEDVLPAFVETVAQSGCTTFYVHARNAWLEGLSPKQNRDVPPLNYGVVHQLKTARPDLEIILNGGLETLDQALSEQGALDGVMMGRGAYATPRELAAVDARVFGDPHALLTDEMLIEELVKLGEEVLAHGRPLHALTRHILGLFHGEPGARAWRQRLSGMGAGPAPPRLIALAADAVLKAKERALSDAG